MRTPRLAALWLPALAAVLAGGCGQDLTAAVARAERLMHGHHYQAAEAQLAPAAARWRRQTPTPTPAGVVAHQRLAELYALYLDDRPRALATLEILAGLAPADVAENARWEAAQLLREGGDEPQRAIAALAELVADRGHHHHAAARALMAEHLAAGATQPALELGLGLLAAAEAGSQARASACRALAQVAEAQLAEGRPEAAVALYGELVAALPEGSLAAQMRFQLGCARQHAGADEPALAAFVASRADHPDPLLVDTKIVRVRQRLAHIHPTGKILSARGRPALAEAPAARSGAARPRS